MAQGSNHIRKEQKPSLFVYHFIFVCNIINLIKCIVCEEINQYQIESPLVLYFKLDTTPGTGSSE